ncbi:acyltransferase [Pseudocolwellia sp. AS88]|uniref:acyltransferase n=1 Tax=Pseudocolwellia sp. AS88 TaxID=3063958 RepID=UPI0026EE4CAF|nr:acyltransferase [Pseudocolwellia sp. AS88]MDO7086720.1 acyltransferase [Pseudocolwellia sp. AS88]
MLKNKFIKISIKKLIVRLHNYILTLCFFFKLRAHYLNLFSNNNICLTSTVHSGVFLFDFANLKIGSGTTINQGCYIDNRCGVNIGDNVNISHDCKIYSQGHDINKCGAPLLNRTVNINDNVWLFPNVTIMPGVTIGKGAIIFPNSVVTKDIPDFHVFGGNPAKFIKIHDPEITWTINNRIHFSK